MTKRPASSRTKIRIASRISLLLVFSKTESLRCDNASSGVAAHDTPAELSI